MARSLRNGASTEGENVSRKDADLVWEGHFALSSLAAGEKRWVMSPHGKD